MADLSKPKKPTFKRGSAADPKGQQLPYGAATDLNEAPVPFPDSENRPEAAEEPLGDLLGGDFDKVLFQPTQRPEEPLTQGSPFGPGANAVRRPMDEANPREAIERVAMSLLGGGTLSSRSQAFLARIARGE